MPNKSIAELGLELSLQRNPFSLRQADGTYAVNHNVPCECLLRSFILMMARLVLLGSFLKFCPKWMQAPILCFLNLWRKGMGYLLSLQLWASGPNPLLTTSCLWQQWLHPPPVLLNQECRELALCIRPLDLLQGDLVMGTGCREPFSGKWLLPGLDKHSLNPHITLKYLSPWSGLYSS